MKTGLDHLPDGKQRELAHVVEIVRAGFARATAQRTQPRFRNGQLLKIVLFGSYARGDWSRIRLAAISPIMICSSSSIMRT
ncbi:hypothetical protein [Sphingobium yanoikuyae]|uniref:nucleotidyltransferase domain-containing protein n=1 Tax=Sphingobium yanoikuyae TaxID=13690 RepID=UPI001F409260|nr:hypothetical protein [Sphingobium yanoikuyae]